MRTANVLILLLPSLWQSKNTSRGQGCYKLDRPTWKSSSTNWRQGNTTLRSRRVVSTKKQCFSSNLSSAFLSIPSGHDHVFVAENHGVVATQRYCTWTTSTPRGETMPGTLRAATYRGNFRQLSYLSSRCWSPVRRAPGKRLGNVWQLLTDGAWWTRRNKIYDDGPVMNAFAKKKRAGSRAKTRTRAPRGACLMLRCDIQTASLKTWPSASMRKNRKQKYEYAKRTRKRPDDRRVTRRLAPSLPLPKTWSGYTFFRNRAIMRSSWRRPHSRHDVSYHQFLRLSLWWGVMEPIGIYYRQPRSQYFITFSIGLTLPEKCNYTRRPRKKI